MKIGVCLETVQLFTLAFFVAIVRFEGGIVLVGACGDEKGICDCVEHVVSFRSVASFLPRLAFRTRVCNISYMLAELSY